MNKALKTAFMTAALLSLAGCMQIDTTVKIEADGSATVTERMLVTKYLLDLDAQHKKDGISFGRLMSREAAEERAQKMGDGVKLASFKEGPVGNGARECIAVFKKPELHGLICVSPFVAYRDYPDLNRIKFNVRGILKPGHWEPYDYGHVVVDIQPLTAEGKALSCPPNTQKRPPAPTPSEAQIFRNLAPVFRDMMKGFHVRLRFQTFGPTPGCVGIAGHAKLPRDGRAGAIFGDIISLSHTDLDQFGGKFLENEEVMLGLVRGDLRIDAITSAVRGCIRNKTVPLLVAPGFEGYRPGWINHKVLFWFPPSRPLFDRYFEGKTIVPRFKRGSKPPPARYKGQKSFPAKWEDIGYQPGARNSGGQKPDKGKAQDKPKTK